MDKRNHPINNPWSLESLRDQLCWRPQRAIFEGPLARQETWAEEARLWSQRLLPSLLCTYVYVYTNLLLEGLLAYYRYVFLLEGASRSHKTTCTYAS